MTDRPPRGQSLCPIQALNAAAQQRLETMGSTDILVGIPSFNNAETIGHVVTMAGEGLRRFFPDQRATIVNADGGSSDGTPESVQRAAVPAGTAVLSTPYRGLSGKGSAFRAIFEAAVLLQARVCVVVDADLRSITPEWMARLVEPIVRHGYDYVAPYYVRHKYDGTITNTIAYPMTAALYGQRLRQPIGGDFAFVGDLARAYLSEDVWQTDVARFGVDIFMTTTAVAQGRRVAQANLGAKVHDPKDPAVSLGPMFSQVVGTLFALMGRYEERWRSVTGSQVVPRFGPWPGVQPEPVEVNVQAMVDRFRVGLRRHRALLELALAGPTLEQVKTLAEAGSVGAAHFPAEAWARVCYDLALAYRFAVVPRESLLDAFTALYFGRTAALVGETAAMDETAFETYVEDQARVFEQLKPYLVERWFGGVAP